LVNIVRGRITEPGLHQTDVRERMPDIPHPLGLVARLHLGRRRMDERNLLPNLKK
jgi:hypothetical protein